MGQSHPPRKVMPIVAAFSCFPEALDWARNWVETRLGELAHVSPIFDFEQTDYYQLSMGPKLKKIFFAPRPLIDPAHLPRLKLDANAAEEEFRHQGIFPVSRPLNLDPGYLTEGKFVLASTKDHAHRLYIGEGVFAEITLGYQRRGWCLMPWTYPDYREPAYHAFLSECRDHYRRLLAEEG